MKKLFLMLLLGCLAPAVVNAAEPSIVDLASQLDAPLRARTMAGVIRSIDLEKRQAEISGYIFDFGPPGLPIKILMESGSSGAFEMLDPGMKVEVIYGDLGTARIAVQVRQLPYDADIEH